MQKEENVKRVRLIVEEAEEVDLLIATFLGGINICFLKW